MTVEVSKILLGLDELFDTRIQTIASFDSNTAYQLLLSKNYWDRESDHWHKLTHGKISDEQFNEAYENRNNDILRGSTITGIFVPFLKLYMENELAIEAGALNKELALEINVYPYTLSLEEMDVLSSLFRKKTGLDDLAITYCSVPLEELTPTYLLSNYVLAFVYHFNEWIKIHLKEMISQRNPDFNLVVPKRFEKDVSGLSNDEKKEELDRFRVYMLEYMDITFIDLQHFSIFRP